MVDQIVLQALDACLKLSIATRQACETSQHEIGYLLFDSYKGKPEDKRLHGNYAQVYSQGFEDGYIAEIFSRIEPKSRSFLEIGVENGLQNTTRLLLEQGWSGVWVEGSVENSNQAREIFRPYIESGKLKIITNFATRENINEILDCANVEKTFDLISIDIDYNTSHIWRALNRTARVYCIEYNSSLPPSIAAEVPYDASGVWDGSNFYGASLKTMEKIGLTKNSSLVGCDIHGLNAYFVVQDECGTHFCDPFTAENHYQYARYSAVTHIGHRPSHMARTWNSSS